MRRVAIAEPPIEDFYYTPHRGSGLGIRTAGRICEQFGKDVYLFHFPTMGKGISIPLPAELKYLQPYLIPGETGALSFFTSYKRFGPSYDACAEMIAETEPDIIFLGSFAFCYIEYLLELAAACRRVKPEVPLAAGGAGVTVNPEYLRNRPGIDYILPGEAEEALPGFFSGLEQGPGLPKIGRAAPGTPVPVWSRTGAAKRRVFYSTALTRGCPRACSFCSVRLTRPGGLHRYPKKVILQNFKTAVSSVYGKNISINLEDDNLISDWEYAVEVITALKKIRPDAVFTAENGLDYTLLDKEKTEKLIDLGFYRFNFSIGTTRAAGSTTGIAEPDCTCGPPGLEELVHLVTEKGKQCTVFFICGFPGDSPENTVQTLLYLHSLPSRTGISLYYPVPGLQNVSLPKETPPRLCAGSSAFPWSGALTTAQMVTAFRLARLSNFLKAGEKKPGRRAGGTGPAGKEDSVCGISAAGYLRAVPFLDSGMIDDFLEDIQLDTTNPLS